MAVPRPHINTYSNAKLVILLSHVFQHLVQENNLIRSKVPDLHRPLIGLHFEKVDKSFSPGLTVIHWISINLDSFISAVTASLKQLQLLITRITDISENRIFLPCKEIEQLALIQLPDFSTSASMFHNTTSELCKAASLRIETKSESVERAVSELIDVLTGPEVILETFEDEKEPGALSVKRRMDQRSKLMTEAEDMRSCYEQVVIDAQFRLLRTSLENIRKRLSVKLLTYDESCKDRPDHPLFESHLILAVPNITMKPSLDEIQQLLNSTVSAITSTTKSVYRWGQTRNIVPHPPPGDLLHSRSGLRSRLHLHSETSQEGASNMKTFYQAVSGHKEIQKLVSALSSAVNSTKRVILAATDKFNNYSHLWEVDRDPKMKEFMEKYNPGVNEFRMEMSDYAKLGSVIDGEPDVMDAGTISLNTEKLKLALTTEMRAWVIIYGRTMNHKYQTVMEEVFRSIDDWTKRLSHPLTDLDDVRSIMATLKEIRENEIEIDMSLDPIEVGCLNRWRSFFHTQ